MLGWVSLTLRADADWRVLAARFPQAAAVVEDSRADYDLRADGKYQAVTHYRATILRRPGLAELASYQDSYYDQYEQVSVKRALVIDPEGRTEVVGPEHIKDLPMPAEDSFYIQNMHLVLVTFPQLRIGSTVEVDLVASRQAPPMDHAFSMQTALQATLPILHQAFSVTLPAAMPLAWKVHRGQIRFARQTQGERATYRWEVGEQPQLVAEPSMPPDEEVTPNLAVSTIASWPEVSRWYADLCRDGQRMTPALTGLVARITAGKRTPEERVRALFFWVCRNIRYVETTYTGAKAGFKPASAQQTLERKYGVCRDKAELLVTLLDSLGLEAHLVLISSGIRQDVDLPGIEFNHAIVALRRPDGGFTFMDPTAEHSRQYLPYSDQGKFALVCTQRGEDIQATPVAPPERNRMDITLDTSLGADGALTAQVVLAPAGICDLALREWLTDLAPADRERFLATEIAKAMPGAVVSQLSLSDPDDLDAPLRLAFTLSAKGQGVRTRDYLLFTTPGQGDCLDPVLAALLPDTTAPRRSHPLELPATLAYRLRETVRLPRAYAVRTLPGPMALHAGAATLVRTCAPVQAGLAYTEQFSVAERYFSGAAYQDLRLLLQRRSRLRDARIVLRRRNQP